jgi:hypothetical protein
MSLGATGTCAPKSIPRLNPEPQVAKNPSCGVMIRDRTPAELSICADCAVTTPWTPGTSTCLLKVPVTVA